MEKLTWAELEEVLLDIEIIGVILNHSLIVGRDVNLPDPASHESERETMKKRCKYIKRCK